MEIKGSFIDTSFKFDDEYPSSLSKYVTDGELYNQKNLLFLEEKYMIECPRFRNIVKKLNKKEFDSELKIYKKEGLSNLSDFSIEVALFFQTILENNINGLNKNELKVSINHFEVYDKDPKINYIQNIYILLFLATSTEYKENHFSFSIKLPDHEVYEEISYDEIKKFSLFDIYSWIISSRENFQTRLRVIREVIVKGENFNLTKIDLESAKSIFNRIIKEETDKYFAQVNMLKEDFFKLSERKQISYNSLHIKFIGWISSLGLFIYGELKNEKNGDLLEKIFFSATEKAYLFLVLFTLAILIIWVMFVKNISDNEKEYDKIKIFYMKQLYFEKIDFNHYLSSPQISLGYKLMFCTLIILLITRGCIASAPVF
ncbi:hypothetical protein P7I10_08335 [Lactococcus lactis]|uniref:hypothetical protein n=1 Tax=Lactococcus lactis TaxID=1358 RepID=UPI00288F41E4|nr:hypothetical protein [Lactococcus lactis]MDT2948933.1 hypothetical protein [Lactococcus lactis]